jgi:hypothetical protein
MSCVELLASIRERRRRSAQHSCEEGAQIRRRLLFMHRYRKSERAPPTPAVKRTKPRFSEPCIGEIRTNSG